ncbi:MAG: hypothetical protein WBN55_10625 [Eudoraea sp.]|uniref:hypothetical protein n=1 Tax=Eudoraea sp. TaxID=1979955 RepID=UPI003C7100C0
MKRSKEFLTVFMVIAFASVFLSCKNNEKKETEKDKPIEELAEITVSPVVIFENDYAKVSKISLAPGESQATHEGEIRLIYALTDFSIDWEEQGKKLGAKTWKKGDVHFHEAGTHAARNNGTTVAEWLVFAKKSTDLPECGENTVENDATSVSPDFAQTLFENEAFKMTQVNLPVGEIIPMHSGINRILYSLTDYNLNYESDKEGKLDKAFTSGDIHWHEACKHALENNGDTEAKFLVVSYR